MQLWRPMLTTVILFASTFVTPMAAQDLNRSRFSPITDEVDMTERGYYFEARAYGDGVLQVVVRAVDGTIVFDSIYPVVKPDGRYVEWTYRATPPIKRSTRLDESVLPSLEGMAGAAKNIIRMIEKGLAPGSQDLSPGRGHSRRFADPRSNSTGPDDVVSDDSWGCDLPDLVNIQCTDRGNCCDTHDACYWEFDCSYWSWVGILPSFCDGCNAAVVLCVAAGVGSNGKPSICCELGNCGQERCTGLRWNDPACSPSGGTDGAAVNFEQNRVDYGGGRFGGGGSTGSSTGSGSASYGPATCCFPDGTCIPCW